VAFLVMTAVGQTISSSLVGTVLDQTGAVVPSAPAAFRFSGWSTYNVRASAGPSHEYGWHNSFSLSFSQIPICLIH
jgi:hypothetical protein